MQDGVARRNLTLATIAFAVSFAVWGLLSGLAPTFKSDYDLGATETALMVAVPVVLGSLGRIPAGALVDRYGGRRMFTYLLLLSAVPPLMLAINHSYTWLLAWGFCLGLAGASFAIGVGFLSPWYAREQQGTALGIFGVGNIGQSIAVFLGPVIARQAGISTTFIVFGLVSVLCAIVFFSFATDAPRKTAPSPLLESLGAVLRRADAWALGLFYFLTFGGFVALGVYLPTLLQDIHDLSAEDAGMRTAGFIILATMARPGGGWIADRIGGERVLIVVFLLVATFAWFLAIAHMPLFTIGALGCALTLGAGSGAVFKLVPMYFPGRTGAATGLVGAAGGLGGFFPPILLGLSRDILDTYVLGFVLLSLFALACAYILRRWSPSDAGGFASMQAS